MKAPKSKVRKPALRTVLVAVHYQNDVLHADGKVRVALADDAAGARRRVVAAAGALLKAAREADIPVVTVQVVYRADYRDVVQNTPIFRKMVGLRAFEAGSWGCDFYEGLGPVGDEFVVQHGRVNPFFASPLDSVLHALGAQRVVIAGLSTHSAVEHTARHAADIGYDVVVVEDACSSSEQATHEASLRSMSLIATITTSDAAVSAFKSGWPDV